MSNDQLARFIDRFTVEFVRVFPHPIERVWRAITDPAELRVWSMPAKVDLRVGGAYGFLGEDWGTILALDPPRLIKCGRASAGDELGPPGANYMQYELEETAEGTRMTFVEHWHEGPDYLAWSIRKFGPAGDDLPGWPEMPFNPGTLKGWHGMFDGLACFLDGDKRQPRTKTEQLDLLNTYREHIRAALPPA